MSKNILLVVIVAAFSLSILFADEDIRNKYLVDKIYGNTDNLVTEYIYDADDKLLKTISTGQFVEQGQLRNLKYVDVFEYENGLVSKIMFYDSTHFMFDYIECFSYNSQGQLIRREFHQKGMFLSKRDFYYKDGIVINSYFDDDANTDSLYFYADTLIYDDSLNVIAHKLIRPELSDFGQPIPSTKRVDTLHYEYDNKPKPNFGIDYLFTYCALPRMGTETGFARELSRNNLTNYVQSGTTWSYTYNENGLPETIETKWKDIEHSPMILTIKYRKKVGITENTIATHLTISPNPTSSNAVISFGLLECSNITFEICDVLGNIFYTFSNFYDAGDHSVSFETKDLSNGNYIVRMLSNNKQIGTEKFAVVR